MLKLLHVDLIFNIFICRHSMAGCNTLMMSGDDVCSSGSSASSPDLSHRLQPPADPYGDHCLMTCQVCSTWFSVTDVTTIHLTCDTCLTTGSTNSPVAIKPEGGYIGQIEASHWNGYRSQGEGVLDLTMATSDDDTNIHDDVKDLNDAMTIKTEDELLDLTMANSDDVTDLSNDVIRKNDVSNALVIDIKKEIEDNEAERHSPHPRSSDRPYLCKACGMNFSTPYGLLEHLRTHTGEKPFSCSVCARGFSKKNNLKRHMVIHTGARDHRCQICERTFSLSQSLKAHYRLHPEFKGLPFKCPDCGDEFRTRKHLNIHHGIRHVTTSQRYIPRDECTEGGGEKAGRGVKRRAEDQPRVAPPRIRTRSMPPLEKIVSCVTLTPSPHPVPVNNRRKSKPRKLVTVVKDTYWK